MSRTEAPDLDAVYELLGDSRRRKLLYHLLEAEYGSVEKLARGIAASEDDTPGRAVPEDVENGVAMDLVHDHLPRLAEYGILEYDARSGDVVADDGLDAIQPFVERAHDAEHDAELPDASRLTVLYSDPPEEEYLLGGD